MKGKQRNHYDEGSLREHPVFSAQVSSFTRRERISTAGNTSAFAGYDEGGMENLVLTVIKFGELLL